MAVWRFTLQSQHDPNFRTPGSGSRFLDQLPEAVREPIVQACVLVDLDKGTSLMKAGFPVEYVYFPTSCMASVAVTVESGQSVEAVTVGNEGFVGISAFLGEKVATLDVFIQMEGRALRMPVQSFRVQAQNEYFRDVLGAYVGKTLATIAQSLACNTFHPIEKRLAKCLLMASDCTERSELPLTQEFLAIMLGVYRPTVTIAIGALTDAGFIEHRRGAIRIVDPGGLTSAACECYEFFGAGHASSAYG